MNKIIKVISGLVLIVIFMQTPSRGSVISYTLEITSGGADSSGGFAGQGRGYLSMKGMFKLTIDTDRGLANLEDINILFGNDSYTLPAWGRLKGTFDGGSLYLSCPNPLNSYDNYLSGNFDGETASLQAGISDGMTDGFGYGCNFTANVISQTSSYVLVYNGTIKATNSIFDVNDANKLLSTTLKCRWALEVSGTGDTKGQIHYSSVLIYDAHQKDIHHKYFRIIADEVSCSPHDPCRVVMLIFNPSDADGQALFYLVGKGRLIKYSNNPLTPKGFVPLTLKGSGAFDNYNMLLPDSICSGPATISMTLDLAATRRANGNLYDADDMVDEAVNQLTANGYWLQL